MLAACVDSRRDPVTISRTVEETNTSLAAASSDTRTDVDGHAGNVTTAYLHFPDVDAGTDLDPQRVHRGDNRCCTVDRDTRAAEDPQKSVADVLTSRPTSARSAGE